MRAVAAFVVAAALSAAGAARAQDTWVEPAGRYSLGFEALGWTGTPSVANAPNIMAFVRNDSPRDDRMRICFVREELVPNSSGFTQAAANRILEGWTDARISQVVRRPVSNVRRVDVRGVTAIDYTSERDGLAIAARFFMIEADVGVQLVTISCSAEAPLTDEEAASMRAVHESLRILQQATP